MKQDLTDITIVLDRSGSMESVKPDTIGGFNAFLDEQKACPGDALLSLVQFDNEYEVVHSGIPLQSVPRLTDKTFVPRGGTAMLDAIGRTIVKTGERLASIPETARPGKVLFVVMTDGHENASVEYSRDQVFKMITEQRETYSWQIVFIGANQDAIATGASIGVAASSSLSYASTPEGTRSVMKNLSGSTLLYRTSKRTSTDPFFDVNAAKP